MIPVMCRVSHKPPEQYGDCLRACVASVMELDAELVPHFADQGVNAEQAWQAAREWLAIRGYTLFVVNLPPDPLTDILEFMGALNPDVHYLLFGMTVEGGPHVVVAKGGAIVHNPAWIGCSVVKPLNGEAWPIWVVAHR